ncbi:hypothetical protein MBLNU459_g5954t1 [Dothideomycetes sp. NU459]
MDRSNDIEDSSDVKHSRLTKLRRYFDQEVVSGWGDLVLIVSCFVTGLLDSAVFNVWSCFVSMQTGNTIYVGLGVSGQPKDQPWRWAKSLTSIVFFMLGAFMFSRLMRLFGELRRKTVVASFFLQATLIYVSAALIQTGVVPEDAGSLLPDNSIVILPLALMALQSAGQIVMSRLLGYGEVTTVVLTSAYCDLVLDPEVLTAPLKANSKRNRRIASVIMLVIGAIAGGYLTQDGDIALALWIAASIKVAVGITWIFWQGNGSIQLE